MAFDQSTRNRLQKFVNDARNLLSEEFTRQLQATYGLDPKAGSVADVATLTHLDNRQRQTAHILRDTLAHYLASTHGKGEADRTKQALSRIVREQAFTVLNRLAALRMAEARGFLLESIAKGYNSKGFQLYKQLAGSAQGETGEAYRNYLYSVFDEFSLDLAVLFDRHSAQGRLFPRESALLELLDLINHHEIELLWAEDETIGWIYQYFNSQEERKKMRAESQAPRNSRELAVRNQFFTPRYVVEFLTDNTLGRIWYEMNQGNTRLVDSCRYLVRRPTEVFLKPGEQAPEEHKEQLKEEGEVDGQESLSQEELLKQPVYIPHRDIKDPRCIRMLDPACGSMHFGLYAFDLFERIYEEAWQLEAELSAEAFVREGDLKPLHQSYDSFEAYKTEIPRLIIEHNIHGVDIDPRAVQIAGLSLWQRAQRAWQQQGIKPQQRPVVRKSNIVCAEPMPGEKTLLQEFASSLNPPVLGQLLEAIFDKMELAGEAGTLLKIEEEIQSSIHQARDQWQTRSGTNSVGDMFQAELDDATPQKKLGFDLSGVDDESFWDGVEQLILQALSDYANTAESNSDQKRLFAEDAARGFAFIDLCRTRFDVVLMNPPFGKAQPDVTTYLKSEFPSCYYDLYTAFIERFCNVLEPRGILGCITSKTFFANSRLRPLRQWLLNAGGLTYCADLGQGVLDGATVETAASIMSPGEITNYVSFFNVSSVDRASVLYSCIKGIDKNVHRISKKLLLDFPNQSFSAYWGSPSLLSIFTRFAKLDPTFADTAAGQMTGDDFRFVRSRWELPMEHNDRWFLFAKGGEFFRYYCDWPLVIDWTQSALVQYRKQTVRSVLISRNAKEFSGRPAIIWNRVNQIGFNVRAMPLGSKFADKAPAVFPRQNSLGLLGVLCSRLMDRLCAIQNPNRMFEVRDVSVLPIPTTAIDDIEECVSRIVELKQTWASRAEPSSLYIAPWGLTRGFVSLRELAESMKNLALANTEELCRLQMRVNNLVEIDAGLSSDDNALLNSMLGEPPSESLLPDFGRDLAGCTQSWYCAELLSYVIGVVFGRWDIRYATGELRSSKMPDPFDTLPVCPPGMLQNPAGLPAKKVDIQLGYPARISWSGVLVNDEGQRDDIVSRIDAVLSIIWGDYSASIEQEVCATLGMRTLGDYFSESKSGSSFFKDHLSRYNKNRRQAIIYWPLSTVSGNYTLWIYHQRLDEQTLYTCVNDYVEPKLAHVEQDLNVLLGKSARNTQEEKQLAQLTDLSVDLRDFRDELLRVASFWKPNLNDGVQVTAAPLWKLFRHKAWQKDLKDIWEKLELGEYDWAHLACSVWPDRVLRKCHQDRSLANAHDVEDIFWHEVEVPVKRGKKSTGQTKLEWQPKVLSDAELNALIQAKIKEMNS